MRVFSPLLLLLHLVFHFGFIGGPLRTIQTQHQHRRIVVVVVVDIVA